MQAILYVYNECVKRDHDEANTRVVFHAYHAEIFLENHSNRR